MQYNKIIDKIKNMSLVDYDSSSHSESEQETSNTEECIKKKYLPTAVKLLGDKKLQPSPEQYDDPNKHNGRTRSFQHERGNWATYVYAQADEDFLEELQLQCLEHLKGILVMELPNEKLHISFSRTCVIQYHLISSFVKSLSAAVDRFSSMHISFERIKIYTNEEKTRTFIALEVSDACNDKMLQLLSAVNTVMCAYRLPEFYEHASFHASFLWCLGDKSALLKTHINKLQSFVSDISTNSVLSLKIDTVKCKCGNKEFEIPLK